MLFYWLQHALDQAQRGKDTVKHLTCILVIAVKPYFQITSQKYAFTETYLTLRACLHSPGLIWGAPCHTYAMWSVSWTRCNWATLWGLWACTNKHVLKRAGNLWPMSQIWSLEPLVPAHRCGTSATFSDGSLHQQLLSCATAGRIGRSQHFSFGGK